MWAEPQIPVIKTLRRSLEMIYLVVSCQKGFFTSRCYALFFLVSCKRIELALSIQTAG